MEKTYILEIPERLSIGLRKINNPVDRQYVMTALFWAFICNAENGDSKYAGNILHQGYAEQAYHHYIEPQCPDSAEDLPPTDDPDRLYAVFESFSQHIDVYGGWASLYRFFYDKMSDVDFSAEDVQFEIHVNPYQLFMQIEVL